MKKLLVLAIVVLVSIGIVLISALNDGAKTLEEALSPAGSKPFKIIHEEKNKQGSIVFYSHLGQDDLSTAVVKKRFGRYKVLYSGVQGDITLFADTFGVAYNYFPSIQGTALPIYFGVIGNTDISKVKILEKKRNIEKEAKIIDAEGIRLWLIYMNQFQGSEFEILGLSADGKTVTKIDDNIQPYYANQKPMKSPYQ